MRYLQEALSKAEEEVAQLQRHVLQLQSQATELFKSNPSQGKLVNHISLQRSWSSLILEEREMGDARGYLANTSKPAILTLSNVQDVSFSRSETLFFRSNRSQNRRLGRGQRRLQCQPT